MDKTAINYSVIANKDNGACLYAAGQAPQKIALTSTGVGTTGATTVSAGSGQSEAVVITRTLKLGSEGDDVIKLQTFLVVKGHLTMPKGVAYGYYGNATKKAVMAFQKSIGLEAVGDLGPKTRASLAALGSTVGTVSTTVSTPSGVVITFIRPLKVGSKGDDVTKLQQILVAKGFLIMPSGIAYGYYGNATKKAVMEYQTSVGLESIGNVGPGTRKSLNSEASTGN
jgi:peptidoglycan hydrolase-like protein with peptidoglycan-binding domain